MNLNIMQQLELKKKAERLETGFEVVAQAYHEFAMIYAPIVHKNKRWTDCGAESCKSFNDFLKTVLEIK